MPTPTEERRVNSPAGALAPRLLRPCSSVLATSLSCGCGGPSSPRVQERSGTRGAADGRVALKNRKEVERDAKLIDERHAAGELSDEKSPGDRGDHRQGAERGTGAAPRRKPTRFGNEIPSSK